MFSKSSAILFLLCASLAIHGQQQWAWMNGDNNWLQGTTIQRGPLGVFSPLTKPHCRSGARTWTDAQGYFWMYGGFGQGRSDEMFKFDPHRSSPTFNQWMWVKGDTADQSVNMSRTRQPVRNTKGVANITSTPGYRYLYASSWTDNNGKFWLFGGDSMTFQKYNDMWMYDPATNIWTWMNGSDKTNQLGVCGASGVYGNTYTPGGRSGACTWTDKNGLLWLFGGTGLDTSNAGISTLQLNDLWVFDPNPASPNYNKWAMVRNNSGALFNRWGVYGSKGVPNATNTPGSRDCFTSWTDVSGNLWLWGGEGVGPRSQNFCLQFLNDLWKYDIASNQWTWISGDSLPNLNGNFGVKCTPSVNNVPPQMREVSAHWIDDCNNLWMFGGFRTSSGGNCQINSVIHNSLWKYDIATNEWTWISGSSLTGAQATYGVQTQLSAANIPSSRMGSAAWRNEEGIWLFGGYGILPNFSAGYVNDLWLYNDKPQAAFSANPAWACSNAQVNFSNNSSYNCNNPLKEYAWNFGDASSGALNISTLLNPTHSFATNNTYTITLIVSNCLEVKDSATRMVTVHPSPLVNNVNNHPACNLSNGQISLNTINGQAPYNYSWANGATTSVVSNISAGIYSVTVTDANNCSTSAVYNLTNTTGPLIVVQGISNVSCNGLSNGFIQTNVNGGNNPHSYSWSNGVTNSAASNLQAGIYTVTVTDASGCSTIANYNITEPSAITVLKDSTEEHCGRNDGSVSVLLNGGTAPYTYQWSNGTSNSTNAQLATGIYTATINDANGCAKNISISVNTSVPVNASIASYQDASCGTNNGSATSNAIGGNGNYNYSWNTGATGFSMSTLVAGLYSLTVTDGFGCIDTASVLISNTQLLQVNSVINHVSCFSGSNGSVVFNPSGGTMPYNFLWSNANTSSTVTNLQAGVYTVTVTDANNCSSTQIVNITEPPQIIINAIAPTTICSGKNASLSTTAMGGTGTLLYNWMPGNISGGNIIVSPTEQTLYTVIVTDSNNCTATQTTTVSVKQLPVVTFTTNTNEGCEELCVSFSTVIPFAYTLVWYFGDNDSSAFISPVHCYNEGTYSASLTVTDNLGCSATAAHVNSIVVHPNPIAAFTSSATSASILNSAIYFTNQSAGASQWHWSFGDIVNSSSTAQHPTHTYNDSGTYVVQLIAINEHGCSDTSSQEIIIYNENAFYIPNTFTPNNDGHNDIFNFKGMGITNDSYELLIFDRWGNLIFKSSSPDIGWNGKANDGNNIAQQDTYVWKIKARDVSGKINSFIGHINLIR